MQCRGFLQQVEQRGGQRPGVEQGLRIKDVYIDKSAGPAQISALVKGLMLAEDSFEEPVPGQKLSKRQLQLLQLLNKGMSNKEISEELGINEHTVKVHLWRLFRRIEVKSRTQAIFYARQQGLLPL